MKKDGFPAFISQLFEFQVFRRGLRLRPSVPRREHRMLALHLRHDASDGDAVGSPLHERLVREAQTLRGLLERPSGIRLPAAARCFPRAWQRGTRRLGQMGRSPDASDEAAASGVSSGRSIQSSPVSTMVPSGFSSQGISRLSFVTSGASASALLRASGAASAL